MNITKNQIPLYKLIIFFKNNQYNNIKKLIKLNNCHQLNNKILIFRTINRLRLKNIIDDINSFSKFIKQELININSKLLIYDIINFFKITCLNILYITNLEVYDIFNIFQYRIYDYYMKLCIIKQMFIEKSKEFSYIIKYCASYIESNLWKKTFYELKHFISSQFKFYDIIINYLEKKIINMFLINKLTRTYFDIHDIDITLINNNIIINKLIQYNKNPIVDIIKSFINPKKEQFTNWLNSYYLQYDINDK